MLIRRTCLKSQNYGFCSHAILFCQRQRKNPINIHEVRLALGGPLFVLAPFSLQGTLIMVIFAPGSSPHIFFPGVEKFVVIDWT